MRTISIFSAGLTSIVGVFIVIYITNNSSAINYTMVPYENGQISGIFISVMFIITGACLSYMYDNFIDIYEEERDDRLRKIIREECESK